MNALENLEMHEINKKIDAIKHVMTEQTKQIGNIVDALMGNQFDTEKGLVEVVKDLKERVRVMENKWNNTKWLMIGIGLASGLTIGKIASMIGAQI